MNIIVYNNMRPWEMRTGQAKPPLPVWYPRELLEVEENEDMLALSKSDHTAGDQNQIDRPIYNMTHNDATINEWVPRKVL